MDPLERRLLLASNSTIFLAPADHYSLGNEPGLNCGYSSASPSSPIAADLDGDGYIDMAVPVMSARAVAVLRNNGDGSFAAPVRYAVGNIPGRLLVADFDGDGDLDLAINHDGASDPTRFYPEISVLLNHGDGTFATHVDAPAGLYGHGGLSGYGFSYQAADVNGDGCADLVGANSEGAPSVLLGNGDGTFTAQAIPQIQRQARGISIAADLNGDGYADLVQQSGQLPDNRFRVLLSNGDGSFAPEAFYPISADVEAPQGFPMAVDMNRDGYLDVVIIYFNASGGVSVSLNRGDGTFAPELRQPGRPGGKDLMHDPLAADLDGDRDIDLVMQTYSADGLAGELLVFRNTGDGILTPPEAYPLVCNGEPMVASAMVAGDVDADGDTDLVLAGAMYVNPGVSDAWFGVARNGGNGVFSFEWHAKDPGLAPSVMPWLVAADIDHDRYVDLLSSATSLYTSVTVLHNLATGTAGDPTAPLDSLSLREGHVAENLAPGAPAGRLTTANAGGPFTYTLVADDGDTDNACFTIVDDQLYTTASFNYEARQTYSIRVRISAPGRKSFVRALAVSILDVDDAVPLVLTGTEAADTITISAAAGQYTIALNGQLSSRWIGEVSSITILSLGGDDSITLDPDVQASSIRGGAGNDTIRAGAGDDTIYGDEGNDSILGNRGDDSIYGNFGDDTIDGGAGADSMMGGLGCDSLAGGIGNDMIYAGDQSDTIDGGDGDDYVEARGKADTVRGGAGNDTVWGGAGDDLLCGEAGNDWIDIGYYAFSDTVDGGDGQDTAESARDDGNDQMLQVEQVTHRPAQALKLVLTGTDADDWISISTSHGMYTTVVNSQVRCYWVEDVSSIAIEGLDGDDVILVDDLVDQGCTIFGGAGNDTIYAGEGNDTILGNAGDDLILGRGGDDRIQGNAGADTLDGGEGQDTALVDLADILSGIEVAM